MQTFEGVQLAHIKFSFIEKNLDHKFQGMISLGFQSTVDYSEESLMQLTFIYVMYFAEQSINN